MKGIEQLENIKQQIDEGKTPNPVTVCTFLGWFNAYRRGWNVVHEINELLDHYDIETYPYFDHVYIDSEINFRKRILQTLEHLTVNGSSSTTTTTIPPESMVLKVGDEISSYNDPTYRIGKLEAANKSLIYVNPDSELSEAITKMLTYDFSQLPVMQQPNRGLKGVISWRSIGIKLSAGKNSTKVRDLMEASFQLISSDTSLFKVIPIIIEHDYVIVENAMKEVSGIVTASDLSLQFQQLSEPFLLVAEIENHIRYILSKLSDDDIKNAKDEKDIERKIDGVSDLTFGEYLRLFQNPTTWTKLNLHIDRKTFCEHLEKTKDIRNNIMHFDPDGLDQDSIETLLEWLDYYKL